MVGGRLSEVSRLATQTGEALALGASLDPVGKDGVVRRGLIVVHL
jgi:hypothetical protein